MHKRSSTGVQDVKTEIETLGERLHCLDATQENCQQHIEKHDIQGQKGVDGNKVMPSIRPA